MAENNSYSEILGWLHKRKVEDSSRFRILDVRWLTACMEVGRPVDSEKYQLPVSQMEQCESNGMGRASNWKLKDRLGLIDG